MRSWVSWALLSVVAAARASSIRDEISVDRFQSTAQNPRSGTVTNLFGASLDVGEDWVFSGPAMVTLEELARAGNRSDALTRHLDWLQSEPLTDGSTVPFHREAKTFRTTFDQLIQRFLEGRQSVLVEVGEPA